MDQSKRHHYVPRMLLRRFSMGGGDNPALYRLDVRTGQIAVSSVHNEAAISYYNKLQHMTTGSPLTVEETLAAVEDQTKPIFDSIVAGRELTTEDRHILATFVYLQYQRTPRAREWSKFAQDHAVQMFAELRLSDHNAVRELLRKTNPHVTDKEVQQTQGEWLSQLESGELRLTTGWDGEVAGMFANADRVPTMLVGRMAWVVLRAPPGASFIIGDHPVCIVDPLATANRGAAWFSSEEVEITIPIHRTACLLLQPRAAFWTTVQADARVVEEVNLRSYAGAEWRAYGEDQQVLQHVRRVAKRRPKLVAQFEPRPPRLVIAEVMEGEPEPFKTTVQAAPRHALIRRYGQDVRPKDLK